jgi:hypothetical protein
MGYMLEGLNYFCFQTWEYLFSSKEDLDLCNLSFIMQAQGSFFKSYPLGV